ncbi:hypothetical protein [Lentibacillus sediminis]|uniref:hypothetical protein n=1 Tax=Lentibacillus sediminis TaxID=1940529 RepID=UPI000C1B8F40|nr:hypothetical protein [Lentibacillus sediminis]
MNCTVGKLRRTGSWIPKIDPFNPLKIPIQNGSAITTAVRVEFGTYEEYYFLKEVDGHVYEIFFDIAFGAEEYDKLLDSYLDIVRSFEVSGVEN